MTRALVLLVALAAGAAAQAPSATESLIDVKDLQSCGLITRFPGDILQPNCLQQSTNLLSDRTGVPTRRSGYSLYNATPCPGVKSIRGLWPFYADSGTQYLVMLSSNSLFYSPNDGTCNYVPGMNGTLSATATMECVQSGASALPNITGAALFCTDGIDPVFATNVTSTQAVTQAPTGYHIGTFRNRVVISGIPGAGANGSGSEFYLSGELNGVDYTIPAVQLSTSPAIISVNGVNDGQAVTCLMGEFQNQFLIGRPYDLWGLSGYDLTDFALRKISNQVGCLEPRSVQEVTNVLYWLSHRGVEGFTGTQINRVSYPIDANILPIISGAGNVLTNSIAGQAAWNLGNLTASGAGAPLSTTISPGNLTVSSTTLTETSTATYALGLLSGTSTYFTASLGLGISSNVVADGNFSQASPTAWQVNASGTNGAGASDNFTSGAQVSITCGGTGGSANPTCPDGLSACAVIYPCGANSINVQVLDGATGNAIASQTINHGDGVKSSTISFNSVMTSSSVYVCFEQGNVGSGCTLNGSGAVIGQTVTEPAGFNLVVDYIAGNNAHMSFYTLANVRISSYVPSGTYTSTTFDTTFSTPTIGPPSIVAYSSSSVVTLTFTNENSADGVTWSAPSTLSPTGPALSGKRYWRYLETFATTNGTTTALSNGLVIPAETTGYYITSCVLVSTPTVYGNLLVNGVTNGGAFTFWTSTGATCAAATATNANWTAQTPNSIITSTTSTPYLGARILFFVDVATETPTLTSLTFTWTQGGGRPPTTSAQWDDRYLLFYTTSTASGATNDHALIYDQNQKWQLWDDEYAASAALLNNVLYTGDSRANGYVYQQDVGQTDNAGAFTMTFQTADFDGGDPNMLKEFSRAYVMLGAPSNNNGAAALACSYALDGSTSTYALSPVILSQAPNAQGYFVAKLAFNASQPVVGHWLNLTCSYTGSVGPVAVHRIRLVYTSRGWD